MGSDAAGNGLSFRRYCQDPATKTSTTGNRAGVHENINHSDSCRWLVSCDGLSASQSRPPATLFWPILAQFGGHQRSLLPGHLDVFCDTKLKKKHGKVDNRKKHKSMHHIPGKPCHPQIFVVQDANSGQICGTNLGI